MATYTWISGGRQSRRVKVFYQPDLTLISEQSMFCPSLQAAALNDDDWARFVTNNKRLDVLQGILVNCQQVPNWYFVVMNT